MKISMNVKMNSEFSGTEYGYVVHGPFAIELFRYRDKWSAGIDLTWKKDGQEWTCHKKAKNKTLSATLMDLSEFIAKKEKENGWA